MGVASVGCCYMKLTCEDTLPSDSHQATVDKSSTSRDAVTLGRDVTVSMLGTVMTCAQKEQARSINRDEGVVAQGDVASACRLEEHRPTSTSLGPVASPDLLHLPDRGGSVFGYPLSQFMAQLPAPHGRLSYEAREVACHSLEAYREKLRGKSELLASGSASRGEGMSLPPSSSRGVALFEGALPQGSSGNYTEKGKHCAKAY